MSRKKEIITDLATLKQLIGGTLNPWYQKLLVPFFAINVVTVLSGMTFLYKNYYLFQETVKEVAKIQAIQQAHTDKIHALEVKQATTETRVGNLEKDKRK